MSRSDANWVQKPNKWLILSILGCLVVGITYFLRSPSQQPQHNGRSLNYWLHRLDPHLHRIEERRKAEAAIKAIGTNGIPWLIREIDSSDWPGIGVVKAVIGESSEDRRLRAKWGFHALGNAGRNGIPALQKILAGERLSAAIYAASILAEMGNEGATALLVGLTNANPEIAEESAMELQAMRDASNLVFSAISNALELTTNKTVAFFIGSAIPKRVVDHDFAIQTLIRNLVSTNPACRYGSVVALESYKDRARHSLPRLAELLADPDDSVREAAQDAIKAITNAGAHKGNSH